MCCCAQKTALMQRVRLGLPLCIRQVQKYIAALKEIKQDGLETNIGF